MQTTVNLKIAPDTKNWLEETAQQTDRTVSAIVRTAIDFYRRGYHLVLSVPEGAFDISQITELTKVLEAQTRALDEYNQSKRA